MSKTKNWVMDLEEKFWDKSIDIIKQSEVVQQAVSDVELLRAELVDWMDVAEVQEQVEEYWTENVT
tara:strand:- start:453 stop:650 length:198 start_codon:yes stop_codon:yes gene_type:complete